MKKRNLIIIILLIFIGVIGSFRLIERKIIISPFNHAKDKIRFTVESGENLQDVVDDLSKHKIISNSFIIKKYIKNNNISEKVVPGEYVFKSNATLQNIISNLHKGILDDTPLKVTIPEGYNIDQIAKELDQRGIIKKEIFIKAIKNYDLPNYIKVSSERKYCLEGYLFPDTYELVKGMEANKIIKKMVNRFEEIMHIVERETGVNIQDENIDKIVTMASLVEKEAEVQQERGKIASVFYNRLDKNMRLESCATILYALGYHKEKVYYKDLKIKSPYNTYIKKGLPKGPIACPGKESLKATVKPEKTNFLYFVSKNDGTHFFTNDYKEFLKVKRKTQGI